MVRIIKEIHGKLRRTGVCAVDVRYCALLVCLAAVAVRVRRAECEGPKGTGGAERAGAVCERHSLRAVLGSGEGVEAGGGAGGGMEGDSGGAGFAGTRGEVRGIAEGLPRGERIRIMRCIASSLRAMRTHAAGARFVIVSGDLMAHSFAASTRLSFPNAAPAGTAAFAEKTVEFVVRLAAGGVAGRAGVRSAGEQRFRLRRLSSSMRSGAFLAEWLVSLRADLRACGAGRSSNDVCDGRLLQRAAAGADASGRDCWCWTICSCRGDMQTCGGKEDAAPAAAQIAWLERTTEQGAAQRMRRSG